VAIDLTVGGCYTGRLEAEVMLHEVLENHTRVRMRTTERESTLIDIKECDEEVVDRSSSTSSTTEEEEKDAVVEGPSLSHCAVHFTDL